MPRNLILLITEQVQHAGGWGWKQFTAGRHSQRNRRRFILFPVGNPEWNRTSKEVLDQPSIWRIGDTAQYNGVVVFNRDFEIVSGHEVQLLTQGERKNNLAFLGKHSYHK